MKKIGLVNIDTSHPFAWAKKMQENPELDMQYAMLFSDGFRGDDEVNWFINKYNMLGRAKSIDELAEKCDIGFVQSCNWEKHIEQALPFIKAGKPVFLDKPFVGSVKDIKKIRELQASGAKFVGSSAVSYAEEIQAFLAQPVEERGEIVSVYGESGVDEFNYGVHVGEILSEIAGAKAVSCKFTATVEREGAKCEIYTVRFENGVVGTYCTYLSGWRPFNVSIMTTKTSCCFTVDAVKTYMELLTRISEHLKTGKQTTADIEAVLNASELMLCGKRSRDFEGGREVRIEELNEDDKFDGYQFEKAYSEAAVIMYKDK